MEISNSKNLVSNATIDAEGNVIVGDNNKIFNLKEAAQSKTILEEIEDLDLQLAKTKEKIDKYPDDPDFRQDLLHLSEKRNKKQKELDILKKEILKLAEDFSRIPINTERLHLAKQHFEQGEFNEARAVLDAEAMGKELDALLDEKDRLKSRMGENEKQLKDKANEFLILARLTAVDYELSDRFEKTIDYYEQSLHAWKTDENIFAFASFLTDHNRFSKSQSLYEEALKIYQRLAQANPEQYEPEVAGTQNNLGNMYANLNTYDKAEEAYQEALKIYQRLAQANPEQYEPYVAGPQNNLGLMYAGLNAYDKAEEAYQEALKIRKRLAQANPEQYEPDLATTQNNLGNMYADLNAYDKAEEAYQEALEIKKRLAQANPEQYEPEVAGTQNNLGIMYADLNAYDKAEEAYQEALEIYQRLAQANPERYEPYVTTTQNNLGSMYADLNAYDKAEEAYQEALEIYQRLAQANQEQYEPDLATTQNRLGSMYADLNAYDEAEAAYQKALEIRKRLAQANPERYEPDLATTQNSLGAMYYQLKAYEKAEEAYQEALEIRKRLAQANSERYEPNVAATQNNLGAMYHHLNANDKAEEAYQEALEIYQRLAQANPERYEPYVATTQNNLGLMYTHLNSYEKAEEAYQEALEIRKRLAQANPERYEPDLADTQNNLGSMYADQNSYDKAEKAYQEALEIRKRLAQTNSRRYNLYLANTLKNLGYLHQALLEQHLDLTFRISGLNYAKQAETTLSIYVADIPRVEGYRSQTLELISYFEKITEEDLLIQAQINKVLPLEEKTTKETALDQKVVYQLEVVKMLEKIWQQNIENSIIKSRLSSALGNLAWHHLFARQFAAAEQASRKGLKIDPSQQWSNTNLALGLLFQGKYEAAKALYNQFRDQPFDDSMDFRTVFLQDLADLETAGITHPDMEKVRALLQQ